MIIKSIHILNFRQFKGLHEVNLMTSKDKPFNVFYGNNGFGKTTTYRAICWCLFNKEPRLKNQKEFQNYRLNFKVVQEMLVNETESVSVKIIFIDKDGNEKTVERSESYKKLKEKTDDEPVKLKYLKDESTLDVTFYNKEGLQTREDDSAEYYIENNIINSSIEDFFFFDGQDIQELVVQNETTYFQDHLNILTGITDMSAVLSNLIKLKNELRKNIPDPKGTSPQARLMRDEALMHKKKEHAKEMVKDINVLEQELSDIKVEIEDCKRIIKKNEITAQIYQKVEIIDIQKNTLNKEYEVIDTKYKTDILESFSNIVLRNEIEEFDTLIAEKIEKKELPSPKLENVEDIVDFLIEDNKLTIKDLNSKLKKSKKIYGSIKWEKGFNKEKFLQEINKYNDGVDTKRKSQIANIATHTKEFTATILNDNPADIFSNAKNSYNEPKEIEKKITKLDDSRAILMEEIGSFDKSIIKDTKKKLDLAEIRHRIASKDLFSKEAKVEENIVMMKDLKEEINKSRKEIDSSSEIIVQFDFVKKSIELLEPAIEIARLEVLKITNNRFKKLIDSTSIKKGFWDASITKKYTLSIKDNNNNDLLPKNGEPLISTGEQFLVGYSYLQSMQEGLELKFPMLIDTPLSAVDDDLRKGIMKNFIELKRKHIQTTFFFTSSELTDELYNLLKPHISNFNEIKISDLDEDNAIESNFEKRKL